MIVLIGATTGVRASEIFGLRCDVQRGTVSGEGEAEGRKEALRPIHHEYVPCITNLPASCGDLCLSQ